MQWAGRSALGIAFEENRAVVAEVRVLRGERQLARAAEFPFPEGTGWDDPARLGKALGHFLRRGRFKSDRAVIGLPARWLMTREATVPPADPDVTANMLRVQAEREFSPEPGSLALDYADEGNPQETRSALLVAATRERLDQVMAVARAARLTALSVTSSTLAVASAASASPWAIMAVASPRNVELALRANGFFCAVKHLPAPGLSQDDPLQEAWATAVAGEMRRASVMLARRPGAAERIQLALWDDFGLSAEAFDALAALPGIDLRLQKTLSDIGATPVEAALDSARFAPACALALLGGNGRKPLVDLLNSRFALPSTSKLGRRVAWVVGVAAAALLAAGGLIFLWASERSAVDRLKARLDGMKTDVTAVSGLAQKVSSAQGWYDGRPKILDWLRDITAAFPPDGGIWVTSLEVKAPAQQSRELRAVLSGKAREEKMVLDVFDKLKKMSSLTEHKMIYMREGGRTSRDISFAISFNFVATE